jgi:hypothetical protein
MSEKILTITIISDCGLPATLPCVLARFAVKIAADGSFSADIFCSAEAQVQALDQLDYVHSVLGQALEASADKWRVINADGKAVADDCDSDPAPSPT